MIDNNLSKINKFKSNITTAKFKTGLFAALVAAATILTIVSLLFLEPARQAATLVIGGYVVVLLTSLHAISVFMSDVRFHRGQVIRYKEKKEFEDNFKEKSAQFNDLYDNIMGELQAKRSVGSFYSSKFASIMELTWETHQWNDNEIIINDKESITCPAKYRDLLVELQNNLGKILKNG